jgi:hypothetical protein
MSGGKDDGGADEGGTGTGGGDGGGSEGGGRDRSGRDTGYGELIDFPGKERAAVDPLGHLADQRRLIIRRSLLATAVGGIVPLPVMDDYLAGRVRAGMLIKLADRRRVDLEPSTAELLADSPESSSLRNATLTAATLVALKLTWKKFFTVLAVSRRAEDMATSFQVGTLFDHYCARLHVGAGLDRLEAVRVRHSAHRAIALTERAALLGAFKDGSRILGQSLLEAPAWVNERLQKAAQNWGRGGAAAEGLDVEAEGEGGRWLDRAAESVEGRLAQLGTSYLARLVSAFESELGDARKQEA